MKIRELDNNKVNWSLKRDILGIVLVKLVLIFSIYYIWFDQPVKTTETNIEQHLFK